MAVYTQIRSSNCLTDQTTDRLQHPRTQIALCFLPSPHSPPWSLLFWLPLPGIICNVFWALFYNAHILKMTSMHQFTNVWSIPIVCNYAWKYYEHNCMWCDHLNYSHVCMSGRQLCSPLYHQRCSKVNRCMRRHACSQLQYNCPVFQTVGLLWNQLGFLHLGAHNFHCLLWIRCQLFSNNYVSAGEQACPHKFDKDQSLRFSLCP